MTTGKHLIPDYHFKLSNEDVEVKIKENLDPIKLNYVWLRDNCRCSECYSHILNQRNINILDIPEDIKPASVVFNNEKLVIVWNNDHHKSEYFTDWLTMNLNLEKLPEPILWSGNDLYSAVTIKESEMSSELKLTDLVRSLFVYGVGFVDEVEPTIEATEKVVTTLFPVQRTFFGDMWELTTKMDHLDSAYTNAKIGTHNDNTYFNDAAGLQIFHLLEHKGTGGETLLVDGFRAVRDVKETSPEFVSCLRNVSVESIYIEPDRNITCFSPILHYHPNNVLKQIRFNLLDRSPRIQMPPHKVGLFYKSLRCLTSKINDKDGEFWVKLRPGLVAFINNWRVLHGRASFEGFRKLGGCYVAMGNLLSRARILKVIN